jgi:hypothetical protein
MTITLTNSELLKILSNQLGQDVTSYTIVDSGAELAEYLQAEVRKAGNPYYYDNKIRCIKALRAAIDEKLKASYMLVESKWAIENWDQFISFVKANGRIPKVSNYNFGNKSATLS